MVDWQIEKLEDVADVKTGPFGSALHADDYVLTGTPIITVEHLGEQMITRQNLPLVSAQDKQRLSAYLLEEGDIVFSRVGSVDRNAYVTKNEEGWLFSGRLLRIRSKSVKLHSRFLVYYFKAEPVKAKIRNIAVGQTMASLNTKLLNSFEIAIPPLPEQRAIASALSDADKYITALEKLIAKKRAIKQGAMQELLTGKRRLPGFEGDWVEKPLCEIADNIIMGQSPDSQYYNIKRIGLPLVQGNADIKDRVTIMRFFTSVITKQCNKDDFIMTVRAPVGNVAKADFECCLGRGVCAIKGNDYIYQLLIYFEPGWEAMSTGSTFDSISGNELREVKFNLPASKKEQAAIATLLSDMDAEIDALTSKLKKARQIKQGMMSELLTGRIRLIQEETDNGENKRNGAEDAKPCNCLVPGQSNSWV